MSTAGPDSTAELVKLARQLERQLARRRVIGRKLAQLEAEIRTTRRFLNDLIRPFSPESVAPSCAQCGRSLFEHAIGELDACQLAAKGQL